MHLVGCNIKKFVTMHGHVNVKLVTCVLWYLHFQMWVLVGFVLDIYLSNLYTM